jgi:hypothetical protein
MPKGKQGNFSNRLHLGCGETYLEGYVNIDFPQSEHTIVRIKADKYTDIRKLDCAAGAVDEVRAHHFLEHFSRAESLALLMRWRRWLKPGGLMVLETPDFEGILRDIISIKDLKKKLELERHLFGSQEARWAVHYDGWFEEKYRFVMNRLGLEVLKIIKFKNNLTRPINYKLPLVLDMIVKAIPDNLAASLGINALPNILCIALKKNAEIDEEAVAKELLSQYLVGKEKTNSAMLDVWMSEFRSASKNINTEKLVI